ncbi:hypothetical protein H4R21_004811, partial [Coemansia helicoidea]
AGDYGACVARGVLKYLAMGWYDAAVLCWRAFMARLAQAEPGTTAQRTGDGVPPTKTGPVYRSTAHELVNFVQLVLLTVERADGSPSSPAARAFGQIRGRYEGRFGENAAAVHDLMDAIAAGYFGVVVQRQQSLFDIVNTLFAAPARPAVAGPEGMD